MSNKIEKLWAYGELDTGQTWTGLRVTLRSKLQAEKSGKINRWSLQADPITFGAFLSWHASKAAGIHNLPWEEFTARAVDAGVTQNAPVDDSLEAGGGDEDPTLSALSIEPPSI